MPTIPVPVRVPVQPVPIIPIPVQVPVQPIQIQTAPVVQVPVQPIPPVFHLKAVVPRRRAAQTGVMDVLMTPLQRPQTVIVPHFQLQRADRPVSPVSPEFPPRLSPTGGDVPIYPESPVFPTGLPQVGPGDFGPIPPLPPSPISPLTPPLPARPRAKEQIVVVGGIPNLQKELLDPTNEYHDPPTRPCDQTFINATGGVRGIDQGLTIEILLKDCLLGFMEAIPTNIFNLIRAMFGGYPEFQGTVDDALQLYRAKTLFKEIGHREGLTKEMVSAIGRATKEDLLARAGQRWLDAGFDTDKASLTWAFTTGFEPFRPRATQEPRYQELIRLEPLKLYRLAVDVYNYLGRDGGVASFLTPARYVAFQEPRSILEAHVLGYTGNPEQHAGMIGMRIPPNMVTKHE